MEQENNLIESIKNDLKNSLSEYRYNHSICVMNKCIELAKVYKVDETEAALAGLLHDNAKEMTYEEYIEYANENGITFDEIELKVVGLLHGKVGADIAKKKYGISDSVKKAIEVHTTTSKDMSILDKILYVSDKIEESRDDKIKDIELERKIATEDIDKAMLLILDGTINELINNKKLIHPNAIITRNSLIDN